MRTWRRPVLVLVLLAGIAGCRSSTEPPAQGRDSGLLTIERLLEIKHPSAPTWSPDGRRLAFVWDASGVQNIWLIDHLADGTSKPRALTAFDAGAVDNLFWGHDGMTLYFVRDGDLWKIPANADRAEPAWTTPALESQVVPSPDGTRVAFVRGGSSGVPDWQRTEGGLWVRSLADGRETRLTHDLGVVNGPSWSPDGARLAFALATVTLRSEAPAYSGGKILYTRVDHGPSTPAYVVATGGGRVTTLTPSPGWDASPAWLDASRLVFQRLADDNKTREFIVGDVRSGKSQVIYREVDPKFWSLSFVAAEISPSPDGRWLGFVSDKDGWDHLYIVPTSGGEAKQVTRGHYEVRNVTWAPDSTRLAFDRSLADGPGVRHVAIGTLDATTGSVQAVEVTTGRGTNIAATWSPNGRSIVYQHTDPHTSPELFLIEASGKAQATQLTDSMPAGVSREAFVGPQLVKYKAPDGQDVPAYLFVPKGLDRSRKHPAIVWIHGDGINQNYDGWHVQRNYAVYYSFHQYLLQRGYVVIAPEYRGSIGFGRDWRQAVAYDVGGKDAEDAAAAAGYLKTLGYVDVERIGVWGLSYGGFFTLIAMADHPTDFRCGIDVAGSVDYRMWYEDPGGAWVVARMGTPATHPAIYDKAAVIDRVGKISRPLLILHGTSDGNVPYLESVRLIDVMLKAGKQIDFMMYPGEFHYFQRAHVLRDAWTRSAAFFEKHLTPGP